MENEKKKVDWLITLLPLAIVVALCVIFFCKSEIRGHNSIVGIWV